MESGVECFKGGEKWHCANINPGSVVSRPPLSFVGKLKGFYRKKTLEAAAPLSPLLLLHSVKKLAMRWLLFLKGNKRFVTNRISPLPPNTTLLGSWGKKSKIFTFLPYQHFICNIDSQNKIQNPNPNPNYKPISCLTSSMKDSCMQGPMKSWKLFPLMSHWMTSSNVKEL